MAPPLAAIVQGPDRSGPDLLREALGMIGFADRVRDRVRTADETRGRCAAIVVTSMDAYRRGSPAATDPALVESLIDMLANLGVTETLVGQSRATDSLWLENREVFLAADLLGYRYETSAGQAYDIVDLAEDIDPDVFDPSGPLAGVGLSRAWREADLRILFAANRTDEDDGYALTLAALPAVLPAIDKDYHYRQRRDIGQVVQTILEVAPADFALIDALVSGHGGGGRRAPLPLATGAVIAADDACMADLAGALKMGLDPFVSGLAAPALRAHETLSRGLILGPLEPWSGWINVDAQKIASLAARRRWPEADRALRPVLQQVDRELFPFRDPVNDWLNGALADVAAAGDAVEGGGQLLAAVNLCVGEFGKAGEAWRISFDKDGLRRREAPINIEPADVADAAFEALAPELLGLAERLRGIAAGAEGLRWRQDDGAVLFDGARRFPIAFASFCEAVEVGRTIQYMNDYIGGQSLILMRDAVGRPVRQIERNLYLPQPNYTAVGGGVTIDVTKIEAIDYTPGRRRMFWKTVRSENDSALADDGIVTFEALGDDTLVTIMGRQHFRLPPLWAAIDRGLTAETRRWLVEDAYRRFLSRTFANLEAVAEGRDVRVGRAWSEDPAGEPMPLERLSDLTRRVQAGEIDVERVFRAITGGGQRRRPSPVRIDEDGFRHFEVAPDARTSPPGRTLAALWRDLRHAAGADAGTPP